MFLIGFAVASLLKDPNWNLTGGEAGIILAMSGRGAWSTSCGATWRTRSVDAGPSSGAFSSSPSSPWPYFTPNNGWIMLAGLRIRRNGRGRSQYRVRSLRSGIRPRQAARLALGLTAVFIPFGLFLGSVAHIIVGDNWRVLIGLGGIPILLLLWLRMVPESPRYLQQQGRIDESS